MKFTALNLFENYLATNRPSVCLVLSDEEGFREWGESAVLKSLSDAKVQRFDRLTKERIYGSYLLPSLFGEEELFIAPLEEGESLIEAKLFDPPKGHHLLLVGKKLLSTTKLYKLFEEKGVIFHLREMKAYEKEKLLIEWLLESAKNEGRIFPVDLAKRFVEMQEGNVALLKREWEKLLTYIGEKRAISPEDLQKIGIRSPKEEVFSFVDALLKGDGSAIYKRLDDLLAIDSSPIALLKLVRNGFQNLLQLHSLLAMGAPPEAIQKDLPYMQGRLLDQLLTSARKTTLRTVQKTLCLIDQLEIEYKGSVRGDALFLDYFVSTILSIR